MYDLVAGGQGLTISRYMSPTESRRQFPTLAEHGPNANELKGTVRADGLAHSVPPHVLDSRNMQSFLQAYCSHLCCIGQIRSQLTSTCARMHVPAPTSHA